MKDLINRMIQFLRIKTINPQIYKNHKLNREFHNKRNLKLKKRKARKTKKLPPPIIKKIIYRKVSQMTMKYHVMKFVMIKIRMII